MFFKFLQFLKAFLPIFDILAPIVSFSSLLKPLHTEAAIDVTLYFLPFILIFAGITISLIVFLASVNCTVFLPVTEVTLYFKFFTVTLLPALIFDAGLAVS